MIIGKINDLSNVRALLERPIWKAAFEELKKLGGETPLGDYPLPGFPDALVKVMKYDTKPLEDCRYETHRQNVDLQFTISGGEVIEWFPASALEADGPFDESTDLQFYRPLASQTAVHKKAGAFSIYYPGDAHRPQVNDGLNPSVFKAVIKLPVDQV
ncbi:YhcH/YjgK/YiaL family protein [Akkermansiaceae bacterium]|nr:YhcH/YjgK/YiaL family protein [Akkermansiaceae bacterium]